MDDTFKIFVRRLVDGQEEAIVESLSPEFLDISEEELSFREAVKIEGRAAVSGGSFILQLSVETEAVMPCAICNREVGVRISISDFSFTEEVENIKSDVFDYSGVLREAILLELPYVAECGGNCPERATLAKYFAKE